MRLLLDTHIVLRIRADSPELSDPLRATLADPAHEKLVSAVSLAEVAIKRTIGKLDAPHNFADGIEEIGLDHLAFTHHHASALETLPLHHRDPFDRMLIAQALAEDATFVTVDSKIEEYEVRTLPSRERGEES